MALNYFYTGRKNKAIQLLNQIYKTKPSSDVHELMEFIMAEEFGYSPQDVSYKYGSWWKGENLNNKSIQIFCTQEIGDIINLLRYVYVLKEKFSVDITLNCYSHFEQLERIMQDVPVCFVKTTKKCNYFTDLAILPFILEKLNFSYPIEFSQLIKTEIPPQDKLNVPVVDVPQNKPNIGIVWKTNIENDSQCCLGLRTVDKAHSQKIKDIPDNIICLLENNYWNLYELMADEAKYNFVVQPLFVDLYDVAMWVNSMDLIISTDSSCVLHLAGWLGKKTYVLLPHNHDSRWGDRDKALWWKNQTIIRQDEYLDWEKPVLELRTKLIKTLFDNI